MEINDWFEWNGVRCTNYGMHALTMPSFIRPNERMEQVTIPGKAGALTLLEGDEVYDALALSTSCVIDDPYGTDPNHPYATTPIEQICGWLKGAGTVKFANRREGYYKGRIANQISFDQAVRGNPHRLFSVQFQCDPFFYLDSGNTSFTITAESGASSTTQLINNPGNISSMPLLVVSGTGEGTIMCGGSTMIIDFAGDNSAIADIKLDCEAKIAYRGTAGSASDPLILYGTRVTGDWFKIPTGSSYFVISGGITSVVVTPRWRCI